MIRKSICLADDDPAEIRRWGAAARLRAGDLRAARNSPRLLAPMLQSTLMNLELSR